MPEEEKKAEKTKNSRYLTAVLLIILFVFAALAIDRLTGFLILKYLPSYSGYIVYLSEGINALLGIFGAYLIYRLLVSVLNLYERREADIGGSELGKFILRLLFYIAVVSIVLIFFGPSLGITLAQSLAGGAVGGIVIGLAVQTILTSILSGFLVSSSRTLTPGEILVLHSTLWGDMVCKVLKVNVLFTEVMTQTNNRVKLPNTVLFSSTSFTYLKNDGSYLYTIQVSIAPDVNVTEFHEKVNLALQQSFSKANEEAPQIYLLSRAFDRYTFNATIKFNDFSELNELIDLTNKGFDQVYWELKHPPIPAPQPMPQAQTAPSRRPRRKRRK